jgi:hypothetical protein
MHLAGTRSALRTSTFRSIRGSMCRRTSKRESLSFVGSWQPKNRLEKAGFDSRSYPQLLPWSTSNNPLLSHDFVVIL